jgi:hypothetical protein
MSPAPYGVRLAVGAAVTVVEETRKLPQTILMYPMTLVSQAAHMVMRFQQNVAELVIKGDATLETIFPPKDEQPEWATFDEDLGDGGDLPSLSSEGDRERLTEGRFALYSQTPDTDDSDDSADDEASNAEPPQAATELDYDSLTLAQLRARLQSLSVADLQSLLAYEEATRARAPFQTLIANRITRASAPK